MLLLAGISYAGGYQIALALGLPSIGLALAPVYPTRDFPPSTLTARNLGRAGNLAAGQVLVFLGVPALAGPVKELRAELGLPKISSRQAMIGQMDAAGWPVFHGFSPSVIPRPAAWTPPPELEDFLAAGPPPVFAGLGSMAPENAAGLSKVIAGAARQAGVRLVIQAGRAGLTRSVPPPGQAIGIGEVPHDWLFPKMAALIHHAGAGTTGAGFRAGTPAIAVPMIGDQPFWAARIAALGTGPRPIPLPRLTVPALAAAIGEATTVPSYRDRARELATRLGGEDGAGPIIATLSRLTR